MFPQNAQHAEQHAVDHDGEQRSQPNREPNAEVREPKDAFTRSSKARNDGEQDDQQGDVGPSDGQETKNAIEEDLASSDGLSEHEMHRSGGHFLSNQTGRHEEGNKNSDQEHDTKFSDGQNETAVNCFQCVRLIIWVFVNVAVRKDRIPARVLV